MCFSDETRSCVRAALAEGPIFGFHMYLCGGRSGSTFVFNDYDSFIAYVSPCEDRNIFLIWGSAQLEKLNRYLEKYQADISKEATGKQRCTNGSRNTCRTLLARRFVIYGRTNHICRVRLIDSGWREDLQGDSRRFKT